MGRWSRALGQAFLHWIAPPADARWLDVGWDRQPGNSAYGIGWPKSTAEKSTRASARNQGAESYMIQQLTMLMREDPNQSLTPAVHRWFPKPRPGGANVMRRFIRNPMNIYVTAVFAIVVGL